MAADYSRTVEDVFLDAAIRSIAVHPCEYYRYLPLHPPRQAHTKQADRLTTLPSWAIDLTITSQQIEPDGLYNDPIHLVRPFTSPIHRRTREKGLVSLAYQSDKSTLHTVGVRIGTIIETSRDILISPDAEPLASATVPAKALYRLYNEMIQPRGIACDVFFCALFEARFGNSTILSEAFRSVVTGGAPADQLLSLQNQVLPRMTDAAQNKILFVTSGGHVGLTYHLDALDRVRAGDEVVRLFGDMIPFVLRRVRGEHERYVMVNVAFVPEHVSGWKWFEKAPEGSTPEDVWRNSGAFRLKEYVIV